MFLILDYVYMKMKKDIERKILVIDEAWSLLERTEDESYIFKIVKTCRKFNLGLLLITQDVGDLLKNDAGKALLNNSEYTLLLRQKPSIIEQVQKTFQLSAQERERHQDCCNASTRRHHSKAPFVRRTCNGLKKCH